MITYFTSESVLPGHPDKVCDQIADAILDAALTQDRDAKMAVECTIKDDLVLIYGEATTIAKLDYPEIASKKLKEIGYDEDYIFVVKVGQQSPEINNAVAKDENDLCAGDQGIIFGYACDETKEYMPLSIQLAHRIGEQLVGNVFLKPDGKTQVTVKYEDGEIVGIDTILISVCHKETVDLMALRSIIKRLVRDYLINQYGLAPDMLKDTKFIINPSGRWTIGGSFGDSGTTGRKIVVDTYGGHGRIGGGALSSKDPSKVDRSAAYYARYVALNIVAAGFAKKCEIQVSYGIGLPDPISIFIETFGTNTVSLKYIHKVIDDNFNFRVGNIIKELDLKRPIYADTACFGHFGRNHFPWEVIKELVL